MLRKGQPSDSETMSERSTDGPKGGEKSQPSEARQCWSEATTTRKAEKTVKMVRGVLLVIAIQSINKYNPKVLNLCLLICIKIDID